MPFSNSKQTQELHKKALSMLAPLGQVEAEEAGVLAMMLAAIALGTLAHIKGDKFYKGFLEGALAENPGIAIAPKSSKKTTH